jgi:hypothetical protein
VAWWAWLLLVWAVLAVLGALVLGRAIRMADRRDLGQDRPAEAGTDEIVPRHSTVRRPPGGVPRQRRL